MVLTVAWRSPKPLVGVQIPLPLPIIGEVAELVDRASLLRKYTGNRIVGSNPTLSAINRLFVLNKYSIMRAIEFLIEETNRPYPGYGGDHLYHYTSVENAKSILRDMSIKGSDSGQQRATRAQTEHKTVSVTRKWGEATGATTGSTDALGKIKNRDVIFILDRKKIEIHHKTIGTSHALDTRGSKFPQDPDEMKRWLKPGSRTFDKADTDGDSKISQAEVDAFIAANPHATEKPKGYWKSQKPLPGHEFEEVIPVPKGVLPLKNILVGVHLHSDAAKADPALAAAEKHF